MTDTALPILHLDPELVVIDKPAWWVVHPTRGARGARVVVHTLKEQLGGEAYAVHRLDRQASGVLALARSRGVAARLGQDIRDGLWRKRYLGLCRGEIHDSEIVDHPVRQGRERRPARTQVDPVATYAGRYSLVSLRTESGRRHQIRYHLKHISHPLVGDTNYGDGRVNRFFRETFGLRRLCLHCAWLRIVHPARPEHLELEAPLAPELQDLLAALERHDGPVA